MPTSKPRKTSACPKKQAKPRLPSETPVPLTPELERRFRELATPNTTEMECTICQGKGLPKIAANGMRMCVVCWKLLADMTLPQRRKVMGLVTSGELNHDRWMDFMEFRLPAFRDWFTSDARMTVPTMAEDKIA